MEEFKNHMSGLTEEELAEWYGEKYGKDYITDTKTMTSAQIDEIKKLYTVDVAQSFVDVGDNDTISQSAREWLNNNTSRGVDLSAQTDDTLLSLSEQDEVIQRNKDFDLENALTDDEIFMRDVQPDIDDYYADLAAREPTDEMINSYYEAQSSADQAMIDDYYDNLIDDTQNIKVVDTPVTGKVIKQTIKNRLKKVLIGGIDALDFYELSLIGMALIEPGVQKALQPIMPMIIPGFKGKVDSKTYGQQVIENLQMTAKISPTAKVSEKIANIPTPQTQELTGMGWVGKMLNR